MSYCVNCGVQLEASLKYCPLCNTPVINPNELEKHMPPSPFPDQKGQVEAVKRKDLAVLLSVVMLTTGITCFLLNLFVLKQALWSLPIIGICAIIWVFAIPAVIYTKLPVYLSILFDGLITGFYLYLLTFLTASNDWFYSIGIPVILLLILLLEAFAFLIKKFRFSFLSTALYFFVELAILCIGLECILDTYLHGSISLMWSAIVLTVCTIISIALITMLSKKRLRNAVRRRLHF